MGFSYNTGGSSVNLTGSPYYPAKVVITGDPGSGCSSNQYKQFNTAAFSGPTYPSLGMESGRNYMTGCWYGIWDLAISRNIRLGGSRFVQLRLEAYNAFNTVSYSGRIDDHAVDQPDQPDAQEQPVPGGWFARPDQADPEDCRIRRRDGCAGAALRATAGPIPVLRGAAMPVAAPLSL